MATQTSSKAHFTTVYIVKDYIGRLHSVTHRPTDGYEGRSDRDQYALMQGLFIDEISHDLAIGPITCHYNQHSHSGINTIKGMKATIVAKQQYVWDYNLPRGERMSNEVHSADWHALLKSYLTQPRKTR